MMSDLAPFSAWAGPRNARTVVLVEAWGADEAKLRSPLVGASGKEFWLMLGEAWGEIWPEEHSRVASLHRYDLAWAKHRQAWLSEASLAFTNVFNFQPSPSNDLKAICRPKAEVAGWPGYDLPALTRAGYLDPQYLGELERLEAELAECSPNLVVAAGGTPAWALLRQTNIGSIRGAVTEGRLGSWKGKVLPTYHPASIFYGSGSAAGSSGWKWRPIIVADLMKAQQEAKSPQIIRPSRSILFDPELGEVQEWVERLLAEKPPLIGCDTETSLGMIDTISLASSPSEILSCQIGPHRQRIGSRWETIWPLRDGRPTPSRWTPSEEVIFWEQIGRVLEDPTLPKIFQNGLYDIQYLLRAGLRPRGCEEDLMLEHHALYPEMRKSLGFLGSIYTSEPAWKLMRKHAADSEKRDE